MNIYEYFENLYKETAATMDEWEALMEIEDMETQLFMDIQEEKIDIEIWAAEHGVDLEAVDEKHNEKHFTLWCWAICGE